MALNLQLTEVRDVILQSWNRSKQYKDLNPMIQGSVKISRMKNSMK